MRLLALDLATVTGWALHDGTLDSGAVRLDLPKPKHGLLVGHKCLRLARWLDGLPPVDVVARESPFIGYRTAMPLLYGLHGVVDAWMAKQAQQPSSLEIAPASLKKWATGSGRAGKAEMVKAARQRWGVEPEDDNHADALMVLAWAMEDHDA